MHSRQTHLQSCNQPGTNMSDMINLDRSLQSEEVGGRLEFNADVIINAAFYFLVDVHPLKSFIISL